MQVDLRSHMHCLASLRRRRTKRGRPSPPQGARQGLVEKKASSCLRFRLARRTIQGRENFNYSEMMCRIDRLNRMDVDARHFEFGPFLWEQMCLILIAGWTRGENRCMQASVKLFVNLTATGGDLQALLPNIGRQPGLSPHPTSISGYGNAFLHNENLHYSRLNPFQGLVHPIWWKHVALVSCSSERHNQKLGI